MNTFNANARVTPAVQRATGLRVLNNNLAIAGNRGREGVHGPDINSSTAHMLAQTRDTARLIYNVIPAANKTNPATPAEAFAIDIVSQVSATKPERQRLYLRRPAAGG